MIDFTLSACALLASLDPAGTIACLALATFGADMTLGASWSPCVDLGRSHAGAVSGTMNMAGNLGAFVTTPAFPYLQEWTGSTSPFFPAVAGLDLLTIAARGFLRADRPLERGIE